MENLSEKFAEYYLLNEPRFIGDLKMRNTIKEKFSYIYSFIQHGQIKEVLTGKDKYSLHYKWAPNYYTYDGLNNDYPMLLCILKFLINEKILNTKQITQNLIQNTDKENITYLFLYIFFSISRIYKEDVSSIFDLKMLVSFINTNFLDKSVPIDDRKDLNFSPNGLMKDFNNLNLGIEFNI